MEQQWTTRHHAAAKAVMEDNPEALVSADAVLDILRYAVFNGTTVARVCSDLALGCPRGALSGGVQ